MCCFKMNGLLILVFLSNLHDPQRFRPNIGSLVDDDEVRLKGFFIRFGHDHIRFPLFSGEGDLVMGVGIVGFGYRSADHAEHGAGHSRTIVPLAEVADLHRCFPRLHFRMLGIAFHKAAHRQRIHFHQQRLLRGIAFFDFQFMGAALDPSRFVLLQLTARIPFGTAAPGQYHRRHKQGGQKNKKMSFHCCVIYFVNGVVIKSSGSLFSRKIVNKFFNFLDSLFFSFRTNR